MLKTSLLSVAIATSIGLSSASYANEGVKNKKEFNIISLQNKYNEMSSVLKRTEFYFDRKIDNLKASASFDENIQKTTKAKSTEIIKINKEIKKIKQLINQKINTVEDFLYVNTGHANNRHRFARKEYWMKQYADKNLNVFKKYCGIDYINISKEIVLVDRKYRLINKSTKTPNCNLVNQILSKGLLNNYSKFIKNFKNFILIDSVNSSTPYSHRFKENGDVTELAYILLPVVLKDNVSDVYFHKYIVENTKGLVDIKYKIHNPIKEFYFKYLEMSLLATIDENITAYEKVNCCLEVEKDNAQQQAEYLETVAAYKGSIKELESIKQYLNKDSLESFHKDGVFYLPLVNKEKRIVEDTMVVLSPKMSVFFADLKNKIKDFTKN